MSIAQEPPRRVGLPTHLDLPHTDDKPVENEYQPLQGMLLRSCLTPHIVELHPDGDYFIGMDCGIYFSNTAAPLDGCRAPDFYFVPNVPALLDDVMRRSYVMWVEKKPPLIVMEFVSRNGSDERDTTEFTGKFWIYERAIRAPYYVIWDWPKEKLDVYFLSKKGYEPMPANSNGRFPIEPMGIELGVWDGPYLHHTEPWLRAWDRTGKLLPTGEESADAEKGRAREERKRANSERTRANVEKQRAEGEKQRADGEKQRAEKLAAKLRELGLDPSQV